MKRFLMILFLAALLLAAAAAEETSPVILISEVMASNDSIDTYQGAGHADWIEVYNAGTASVDLGGWGLSDNPEKGTKWHIYMIFFHRCLPVPS